MPLEETLDLTNALQRVAADIEQFGWHVIQVNGGGTSLGFCFTIGLTETYGHPELLLYATGPEVGGMATYLKPIVEQIAAGKRFVDGDKCPEAFKQHTGAFRQVLDRYKPAVVGTALNYYDEKPFDLLQLYWPDGQGHFPWQSDFNDGLPAVPCLFEDNLYLAGLDPEDGCWLLEQQDGATVEAWINELLLLPTPEEQPALAAAWAHFQDSLPRQSWLERLTKKDRGTLARITIMGDPVVLEAKGSIQCWDASLGNKVLLAQQQELLPLELMRLSPALFPRKVLLHARDLNHWPAPGQVFSWRQDPKREGGKVHINNLDHASAAVHLTFAGDRLRKSLAK